MSELSDKVLLEMYRQLHYLPPRVPCDVCPEKLYDDRVQACDRAGCGIVQQYMAAKYYHDKVRCSEQTTKEAEG